MVEDLTETARQAWLDARHKAFALGSPLVHSSHLLYGLIANKFSVAAGLIRYCGRAGIDAIEMDLEGMLIPGPGCPEPEIPLTFDGELAIQKASDIWRRDWDIISKSRCSAGISPCSYRVGTGHILRGLLSVDDCGAARFLARYGISYPAVNAVAEAVLRCWQDEEAGKAEE